MDKSDNFRYKLFSCLTGELVIGTKDIGSGWYIGRTSIKNGIFPVTHMWELDAMLIKVSLIV